ncbi:hypothetical protein ACFL2D_02740 [Patescibacteria group bacterium]
MKQNQKQSNSAVVSRENRSLFTGFALVFTIVVFGWGGIFLGKKIGIIPESFLASESVTQEVLAEMEDEAEQTPAFQDYDNDGLNNYSEAQAGTNMNSQDTDGDGFTDQEEVANGFDPLTPQSAQLEVEEVADPFQEDSDQDGLSDAVEKSYGTNRFEADSDGDGYTDSEEIASGNDPLK